MGDLNLGQIPFSASTAGSTRTRRGKKRAARPAKPVVPGAYGPVVAPMFELVAGQIERPLQERSSLPTTIFSIIAHTGVFGVAFILFSLSTGIALPTPRQASNLIAVVVAAPPPPPPPAPAAPAPTTPTAPQAAPSSPAPLPPPIDAPLQDLNAALPGFAMAAPEERPVGFGLGGLGDGPALASGFGVEGGVGWGTGAGGPQGPTEPVKVEGPSAPTLVQRVEPVYPKEASAARIQGTVIVEATVNEQGSVVDVRILRSIGELDDAAVAAVKQWRYEPLKVDGQPASFIITINVSFHLR